MGNLGLIVNTSEVRLDHGNSDHVIGVKGRPAVSQMPLLLARVMGQMRSDLQWEPSPPKAPIAERL